MITHPVNPPQPPVTTPVATHRAVAPDLVGWLHAAPVGQWDQRGGAMWMGHETWGLIVDALIGHRASSDHRKAVNSESTSDMRSMACIHLIEWLNAVKLSPAPPGPPVFEPHPSHEQCASCITAGNAA